MFISKIVTQGKHIGLYAQDPWAPRPTYNDEVII